MRNVRALWLSTSQFLARRRRPSQASVHSITQRLGKTTKASALFERLTISTSTGCSVVRTAARNSGPWWPPSKT